MTNEIKVKYEYAPDYRKIPATGAWGGLSPNAEVIVNFYVEFKTKPDSATLHVDENGHIKEETQEQDDISLTRELLMGLVLRPDIAKSIGSFLIKHAEMAEEAIAQVRKESQSEGE